MKKPCCLPLHSQINPLQLCSYACSFPSAINPNLGSLGWPKVKRVSNISNDTGYPKKLLTPSFCEIYSNKDTWYLYSVEYKLCLKWILYLLGTSHRFCRHDLYDDKLNTTRLNSYFMIPCSISDYLLWMSLTVSQRVLVAGWIPLYCPVPWWPFPGLLLQPPGEFLWGIHYQTL